MVSEYCNFQFMFSEALEAEKKMESQEDSVERYEAAVRRIKEMTGEDNLDLDVPRFIEVEDRNFALFNYVNEMNNEIELLRDLMREVRLTKVDSAMFFLLV